MDYVRPMEAVAESLDAAEKKAGLPLRDLLIRGFLAGSILGFATSLAVMAQSQGLPPIIGAVLFPVGFVILVLLGLELVTGNFALLSQGVAASRIGFRKLVRNWWWVYAGNLAGSLFFSLLFYFAVTNFGTSDGGKIGDLVRQIAQRKTVAYEAIGLNGWAAALVKGVLCNWMVTVGVMLAFVSRSTAGKVVAMWLPIMTFFALGYEHVVVNMFVIPAGIFLGTPVSLLDWWLWNLIPVTIGNIIGGALFTGLALYITYRPASLRSPVLARSSKGRRWPQTIPSNFPSINSQPSLQDGIPVLASFNITPTYQKESNNNVEQ